MRIVHFACHGEVNPGNAYTAIYLTQDKQLAPEVFRVAPLGKQFSPLLFLNACQVGGATALLGDYAGFAAGALRGGFSAFVAPLWSVEDEIARDIAKDFYDRALPGGGRTGEPLADILRDVHRKYDPENDPHSTYLAYVFYGHPALRLT